MEDNELMVDGVTGEVIEGNGDFKRGLVTGVGISAAVGLAVFIGKKIYAKVQAKKQAEMEAQVESEDSSCQNGDVE